MLILLLLLVYVDNAHVCAQIKNLHQLTKLPVLFHEPATVVHCDDNGNNDKIYFFGDRYRAHHYRQNNHNLDIRSSILIYNVKSDSYRQLSRYEDFRSLHMHPEGHSVSVYYPKDDKSIKPYYISFHNKYIGVFKNDATAMGRIPWNMKFGIGSDVLCILLSANS